MRIFRNHLPQAEKEGGYDCIRCHVKRYARQNALNPDALSTVKAAYDDMFCRFAYPGGYPLIYTNDHGDILCHDCARRYFIMDKSDITVDTYEEGPDVSCDNCEASIESAHGDPWEEES